jgi:hypothetical protein
MSSSSAKRVTIFSSTFKIEAVTAGSFLKKSLAVLPLLVLPLPCWTQLILRDSWLQNLAYNMLQKVRTGSDPDKKYEQYRSGQRTPLTWIRCLARRQSAEVKGEDFSVFPSSCSLMARLKRYSMALIHMCIAVQL